MSDTTRADTTQNIPESPPPRPHAPGEKGSVGLVETQYFTFAEPGNEMVLESGAKLGPITLAYETYGTLGPDGRNAILICHALSGDAHAAGRHSDQDRKPGWWDAMIGPGKAFDTNKYFVVCSNVLGGCMGSTGPSATNPATGKPYGLDFPIITVADMVRAQRELVAFLGIQELLSVAGGSMGGMQTLEWATRYPDFVRSAMVIASTHLSGAQQIAFDAVGRNAIQADPSFDNGQYYEGEPPTQGLGIARMLAHITYLSDESMRAKFGRRLKIQQGENLLDTDQFRYEFDSEFAVETYLDYQGKQFVNRFDANTYLYVTKAMDYFDISSRFGSLDGAMAEIKSKTLVLAFSSDWLYPPYQSEQIVYALSRNEKDVTYCNIHSAYGHDAFLLEVDVMEKIISGFLDHAMHPEKVRERVLGPDGTTGGDKAASALSIYEGHRFDYDTIVDLIEPGSRVLDAGCGDGELLCQLIAKKNVSGVGIEKAQGNVVTCVRRGISVIQADIDKGLTELPDQSFDYVILSMTLQVVKHPDKALQEMLRVGKKCIVTFPNFSYWRARFHAFFKGRAPVTRNLPYSWYNTPNRHVITIKDFRTFCAQHDIQIEREIPLSSQGETPFMPNLFAEEAVYILSSLHQPGS